MPHRRAATRQGSDPRGAPVGHSPSGKNEVSESIEASSGLKRQRYPLRRPRLRTANRKKRAIPPVPLYFRVFPNGFKVDIQRFPSVFTGTAIRCNRPGCSISADCASDSGALYFFCLISGISFIPITGIYRRPHQAGGTV